MELNHTHILETNQICSTNKSNMSLRQRGPKPQIEEHSLNNIIYNNEDGASKSNMRRKPQSKIQGQIKVSKQNMRTKPQNKL